MLPARGEALQTSFTHGARMAAIEQERSRSALVSECKQPRKSQMYKINRVVQMTPSLQRIQQQQTLRAGFISLRLSAATPKDINSLEETVEEENA